MGARILLVEDHTESLELMAYLLTAFGHAVFTARNGEAGLSLAERERPDLVLCDVNLPGIDGCEMARRFKADSVLRDTPLVAVTAFAMVGDRERILATGFDGYLPKPIEPEAFVSQVEAFLSGRRKD